MMQHVARSRWILLVLSAALCAGVLGPGRKLLPRLPVGDAELAELQSARDSLQGNDDRTRDEWRKRAEAAQPPVWSAASLAALATRLGPAWPMTTEPIGSRRDAKFSRQDVPLREWPGIVRAIDVLEQTPGLDFVSLEITAGGAGPQRRFIRVAITVRVTLEAGSGSAERAPSLRPFPVAPPSPPVPRGRAGALHSLRRPATSVAGQAAVAGGPSSAPGSRNSSIQTT